MKLIDILDCVEHETFIGKKTRIDYKNMYIISYKNPLPSLRSCYKGEKMLSIFKDLSIKFPKDMCSLPCYAIFSYETLVAYIIYDIHYKSIAIIVTNKNYSRTTSKHITQLLRCFYRTFHKIPLIYDIKHYFVDFSIFDN